MGTRRSTVGNNTHEVVWNSQGVELEREGRFLQMVCYWYGDENAEMEIEHKKENEHTLPDSQDPMPSVLWVLTAYTKG